MGIENHDRLDKVLHAEEYIGMTCGSLGYVRKEVAGGSAAGHVYNLVPGDDGQPKTEKKYCCSDCPTLISEHRGA